MMKLLSRKKMAESRDVSLSTERRLEKMYPDKYPEMIAITPRRRVCTEEENDRFNRFLVEQATGKAVMQEELGG